MTDKTSTAPVATEPPPGWPDCGGTRPAVLTTRRLVLRELSPREAVDVIAGIPPESGPTWAAGYPLEGTLVAADALVRAGRTGKWQPGFGMFQIVLASKDAIVGDIGLHAAPDEAGSVEIGYGIVPELRGRGVATEAAAALVRWVMERPGVTEVVAETEVDHAASRRVLERAGFTEIDSDGATVRYALRPRYVAHEG